MALDPIPIGDQIATYLFQNSLAAPGTPIGLPQIKIIWENIMTMIYNDIKASADVLPASHSGESLSSPTGQPIVVTTGPGTGSTGATAADAEVVGMGSIV